MERDPDTITHLRVTGEAEGRKGLIKCPTCNASKGLRLTAKIKEPSVSAVCPKGHKWRESGFTGKDLDELLHTHPQATIEYTS